MLTDLGENREMPMADWGAEPTVARRWAGEGALGAVGTPAQVRGQGRCLPDRMHQG